MVVLRSPTAGDEAQMLPLRLWGAADVDVHPAQVNA